MSTTTADQVRCKGDTLPRGRRPLSAADVMTAAEVAELLHVSKSTVENWARRGIVPSKKVGRLRLYIRSKIETLLLEDHAGSGE
jgi:excisionase family DNA binding protein